MQDMQNSLHLYGLKQPSLMYTDNILADRDFLESMFPSLREGVIPIEKYCHLEPLTLAPDIQVFLKNTVQSINDAMSTILNDLSESSDSHITLGFDSEWNVEVSGNGTVFHCGKTAIVQIAYEK